MSLSLLLLGILPILVFAFLDSFLSLEKALIGAILAVALEVGFSLYYFGELDSFSWFNLGLIFVFAIIAKKFNSGILFKLQPSIVSLCLGAYLTISYALGEPVMYTLLIKYKEQISEMLSGSPEQLEMIFQPRMLELMKESTLTIGIVHFIHAALTAFAAIKLGNFAWVCSRLSIYILLFVAIQWAAFRI